MQAPMPSSEPEGPFLYPIEGASDLTPIYLLDDNASLSADRHGHLQWLVVSPVQVS
jgi:hypothetical protein